MTDIAVFVATCIVSTDAECIMVDFAIIDAMTDIAAFVAPCIVSNDVEGFVIDVAVYCVTRLQDESQ